MQNYEENEIRYLTAFDDEFPDKLRFIPNAPDGIYVKGVLPDPDKPSVAIIGARDCSAYGASMAKYFAESLSDAGVQIISGMARGIDGIAQKAAVEAGHSSFGVLGSGIDVIYPKQNKDLFERIVEKGGLISEYPPSTQAIARNFPLRNRIISALSDVILVVESKIKSGTSITVKRAIEQGKDVYAIPGRISDPLSSGCLKLIEDGAGIALAPSSILGSMGIFDTEESEFKLSSKVPLSKKEARVYKVLDFYPRSLEELSNMSDLSLPDLISVLLQLELKGVATEVGKNNYIKIL